jgi:hypothetical protein
MINFIIILQTMDIHTVSFAVDNVTPITHNLEVNTLRECFDSLTKITKIDNSIINLEALDNSNEKVYSSLLGHNDELGEQFKPYIDNGFLTTCTLAYKYHGDLELWSEHIKLLVLQAFSLHIKENSHKFRSMLVSHDNKKTIEIRRDDFIKPISVNQCQALDGQVKGANNPWPEVFQQFGKALQNDTKDKLLVDMILQTSQTTTISTQVASNIVLMDTFQKYYDYSMMTACGIKTIILKGSVEDWKNIRTLINYIEKFDFKWYTSKIIPVIDKFIRASEGNVNVEFFQNMVKKSGGSGGPYYSGWIKYFFPYLVYGNRHIKSDFNADITSKQIPSGIKSVPFIWNYLNNKVNMQIYAGFVGTTIVNNTLFRPCVSWAVAEIKDNIVETYQKGIYYNPANKHYNNPNGTVSCDRCKREDIKVCIGYGENYDLCMTCVDEISKIR